MGSKDSKSASQNACTCHKEVENRLGKAYQDFVSKYCDKDDGLYVLNCVFEGAFLSYLYSIGLNEDVDFWKKYKCSYISSHFRSFPLDGLSCMSVLVGVNVRQWPSN